MGDSLSEQEGEYHSVIETLFLTFGQVLSRDVICAVVENCSGDMDESANAIMNITNDKEEQLSPLHVEHNAGVQPSFDDNNIVKSDSENSIISNQNRKQFGSSSNIELCSEPHKSQCLAENMSQSNVSYSGVAQSVARPSGYTNNQINTVPRSDLDFWTRQIKQILMHHNNGTRILIIMRGLPGSGKTYLARKILEATIGGNIFDFKIHIFSTDDYFLINGFYRFDKMKLQDAHIWNQTKARSAMKQGLSPVIIDNTNVEPWEMEPYLRDGVENGYLIEIVEPNTPWAKRANQLAHKNIHSVPVHTIRRMLLNFQNGITAEKLLNYYKLSYPKNMFPPILRNFPVIQIQGVPAEKSNHNTNAVYNIQHSEHSCNPVNENMSFQNEETIFNMPGLSDEQLQEKNNKYDNSVNANNAKNEQYELENNLEQYAEPDTQLEKHEQIDEAWETNEKWEDDSAGIKTTCDINDVKESSENSKPPRETFNKFKRKLEESKSDVENLLMKCQDWTKIDMFMQPWDDNVKLDEAKPVIPVEKVSSGTSVDPGDTDIFIANKAYKMLCAVPRDINLYYMPLDKEKIPKKRMLDKSSMINEQMLSEDENEDKQFTVFRNLFKNIPKSNLRSIFDMCYGDVSWATSIVLEGVANDEFSMVKSEDSFDTDEENPCSDEKTSKCYDDHHINKITSCESKPNTSAKTDQYSEETMNNISPYDNSEPSTSAKADQLLENSTEYVLSTPKKGKKVNTSEHLINLKRQIERNVVISENHYSKHCLKIRNQRQGIRSEVAADLNENPEHPDRETIEAPGSSRSPDEEIPSTSNSDMEIHANNNNDSGNGSNSDDGENNIAKSEIIININLSWDFISKLDEYFGRDNMVYPEYVTPIINIPASLLNEINALWMESFLNQAQAKLEETQLMIQQDEAIARELEKKEFQLDYAAEPEIPDFKSLMDNELALSLYHKYTSEWRNNEPTDLAAKLTREKLYNLFPDIEQNTLSQLLMAHNNNFYNTVEGLLLSTGQTEIVKRENGVKDFIIAKGMERREKLRKEHKKVLSESEPIFAASTGKTLDMKMVESYRKEANQHLTKRNLIYEKVREYMSQGNAQVASYYSEVAALHTQKYEHANSLAAAILIQEGTYKNSYTATLDLHHLRVREAMEGLDMFLDTNINKLREIQSTSHVNYMTLYFITGRGLHSPGLPRIKPAVKRRLSERAVAFNERNPGLLMAKIYAGHKMTHEIA